MAVEHCHGCVCDQLRADVVVVPVTSQVLAHLVDGWSAPVQFMAQPVPGRPWMLELTLRSWDPLLPVAEDRP